MPTLQVESARVVAAGPSPATHSRGQWGCQLPAPRWPPPRSHAPAPRAAAAPRQRLAPEPPAPPPAPAADEDVALVGGWMDAPPVCLRPQPQPAGGPLKPKPTCSKAVLLPPSTIDVAEPSGCSSTRPWPLGRPTRRLPLTSTPSANNAASIQAAALSLPKRVTKRAERAVPRVRRAAATAWFAPLPPTACVAVGWRAMMVSCGAGRRSTETMTSKFSDPTTRMGGGGLAAAV